MFPFSFLGAFTFHLHCHNSINLYCSLTFSLDYFTNDVFHHYHILSLLYLPFFYLSLSLFPEFSLSFSSTVAMAASRTRRESWVCVLLCLMFMTGTVCVCACMCVCARLSVNLRINSVPRYVSSCVLPRLCVHVRLFPMWVIENWKCDCVRIYWRCVPVCLSL